MGGFAIGDKVCALVAGGGYAEYCAVPVQQCLPIPAGLSDVEAAGLPETYFTVWSNVFDRGGLAAGESLLVHGGASGIGTRRSSWPAPWAIKVYGTAGSDERARAIEKLGAARGINYRDQDFVEEVLDATGGAGVNVDPGHGGGDYIARDIHCLADEGRIVLIATLGGNHGQVDFGQVMRRRLTITGSTAAPASGRLQGEIAHSLRRHVWPLLGKPERSSPSSMPPSLEQAAQAHAMMEAGEQIGKIILTVKGDSRPADGPASLR